MSLNDWPRSERPRERLLSTGPSALSDGELLAVLHRRRLSAGATPRSSRAAYSSAGAASLRSCRAARRARGTSTDSGQRGSRGYWPPSSSGAAISRRRAIPAAALTAPLDAARFFKARLTDLPHEVFCCLFLDTRHRLIRYEELFRGTIDGATVYPREVVKRALQHNASAVILGHNHPSGVSEPSEADRSITLKLAKALALVEIRLLDHLVVSRGGHVSLAERGWI